MRPIPPPPQTQAQSTTTFKVPILDGSVTIPEIYDWHLQNSPNHRLFIYTRDDGTKRTILWREAVKAVHTGARQIYELTKGASGYVVAILAAADTISYFTLIMSITRANCVAFPISPRNSAAAVAHLINKVGVKHVLVGREQAMVDLANSAFDILSKQSAAVPAMTPVPLFEDLFHPANGEQEQEVPYNRKPTDLAVYLHSSGSTAFPKPIPWTHRTYVEMSLDPWFGERDLTDKVLSIAVMPMFHGMGLGQTCWTASSGLVISAFEPKSPAQTPTPDALFHSAKVSESDVVFCVPSFVEAWSRNPEYVRWLATRWGVLTGGGPLNKEAGDYMSSQGVSVFLLYGLTECGIGTPILPGDVGKDWNYITFSGSIRPKMVPQGDGTFELVLLDNPYTRPMVINTQVDGVDAYATSDLMIPHPTKAGHWRIHGRSDDQIMHNTGEKTNPGPLESLLNRDQHVLSSVMFGRGRFQAGVLVDPKPEFKFDPADEKKLQDFRNKIWPTVVKMNDFAPQHSRLFKEMILISKPSKPFTYTAKNTARRQAIINDYQEEIDRLYDAVEETTQSSIPPPAQWDASGTLNFVRDVVCQVLVDRQISDADDLFENGCDSLQATWIRNTLLRALRESAELDTRRMPSNFVYDHPTISRLASFVLTLAHGNAVEPVGGNVQEMRAMVGKYTAGLSKPTVTATAPGDGDAVVLAGSTGAIGSQILVALALDVTVQHVYALNRRHPTKSLKDRQTSALTERGLPVEILEQGKVTLLEVDFAAPFLGLKKEQYQEIQGKATHIIHNVWRVDFNLALTSFESNVKNVRTMLEFALAAPRSPKFMFVSSIGVFQNTATLPRPIPERAIPPEVAVGMGYSESKWVAETVIDEVSEATGLSTLVVRVGQVSGAPNGAWNAKEWFPSLVQASCKLGCLPTFANEDKLLSWLPAEQATKSFTELRQASNEVRFVHLVHPRPISWRTLGAILVDTLKLEFVPYTAWLVKLEEACERENGLNAASLLPFFRKIPDTKECGTQEAFGLPSLGMAQGTAFCPSLSIADEIDKNDVEQWLGYWRAIGMLDL